jgi:hypothetical protein
MAKAVAQDKTLKSQLRSDGGVKIQYGADKKITLWQYGDNGVDFDAFVEVDGSGRPLNSQTDLSGVHMIRFDSGGQLCWVEWMNGTLTGPLVPSATEPLWLYPMAGFLMPWGLIRFLLWIGSGFFGEDAKTE